MDESSLRASIKALESCIDSYGFVLNVFSGVVALGVVLEIVFVVHSYLEDRNDWKSGIIRPPAMPSKKWLWFEVAGVLLVSIGVAGEFWIDVKVGEFGTKLRKSNADLVLILEGRVDGTAAVAAKAKEDSEIAIANAAIAVKDVGKAKTAVDSVAAKATELDIQVSHIASRLAWRHIDPARFEEYKNRLLPFAGSTAVIDDQGKGDSETKAFIGELIALLHAAKWNVTPAGNSFDAPERGLFIYWDGRNKAGREFSTIFSEFPQTRIGVSPTSPGISVFVRVGMRPTP